MADISALFIEALNGSSAAEEELRRLSTSGNIGDEVAATAALTRLDVRRKAAGVLTQVSGGALQTAGALDPAAAKAVLTKFFLAVVVVVGLGVIIAARNRR